jgi:hypothetical protein
MENLEKFFEDVFVKKAPYQLPVGVKGWLVKFAPWLVIVSVILSVFSLLSMLTLESYLGRVGVAIGVSLGLRYYLGIAVFAVQTLIIAASFPGLKSKHTSGWRMLYYSALLSVAYAVVSSYSFGSIIFSLAGSAIGLYILFQVKSYYTETGTAGVLAEKVEAKVQEVAKKIQ